MKRRLLAALVMLVMAACAGDEPSPDPTGTGESPAASPTGTAATASPAATGDPLVLASGATGTGIDWELRLQTGEPVCVQLRRTDEVGDFLVCDEDSEQDFNGDEDLRYAFGGLNPDQVPKFVIGITSPEVARVVINLSDDVSPEASTISSTAAEDRRFFVVELPSEPAREVLAVRGLDGAGRTVAGFRLGPPEEEPSPLPTE